MDFTDFMSNLIQKTTKLVNTFDIKGMQLAKFLWKMSLKMMKRKLISVLAAILLGVQGYAQQVSTSDLPVNGISGMIAVGEFSIEHPDKFFSTLSGNNYIDVPYLFMTRQMILGNTLRLGGNVYFMNGILYGSQMGVMGNNWGMGTREGFIWRPHATFALVVWNQYFQSLSVYAPVVYPLTKGDMAAILMPATPEVFSFGVQASFVTGEFIIGIGASVSPVPFQKRRHSELRYK
jgi:hypothetical protein